MEDFFSSHFWERAYEKGTTWLIVEVPSIIILLIILFIALRLLRFLIKKLKKIILNRTNKDNGLETEKRVNTLMDILKGTGSIILWVIFIMMFLRKVNIDIGPLIAGAGIAGLAIGFGAQELVRDFITGFFILLENQVRVGDVAQINGTGGLVEKIELRTITLRSQDGTVHIFQNGKINTLANMTKEWSAMVFEIGVAYKENIDTVMEVMKDVGDVMQKDKKYKALIIEPLEMMGIEQFGPSAVVIKARFKTKPIEQWTVGREYRRRLKIAFDEKNIEIPFPHTTIYWGEKIEPLKLLIDKKGENGKEPMPHRNK